MTEKERSRPSESSRKLFPPSESAIMAALSRYFKPSLSKSERVNREEEFLLRSTLRYFGATRS